MNISLFSPPRVTLHVGVAGHIALPSGSEAKLRETVAYILQKIQRLVEEIADDPLRSLFADESPRFRLLSSLAAGADCLVARQALKLGYELQVPLPMRREIFQQNFRDAEEKRLFDELIAHATSVLEIEASNPEKNHAYADASRVLLNHSDLLIALWDGEESGFMAGTAATVAMASAMHVPTVHIVPGAAPKISLIKDGCVTRAWEEELRSHLSAILLPEKREDAGTRKKASRFAEIFFRQKNVSVASVPNLEKWLSNVIEKIPPRFQWSNTEAPNAGTRDIPSVAHADWHPLYERFDRLSGHYSSKYRSCLVLRFAAPVAAIFFLVMGLYGDAWMNLVRNDAGAAADLFKGWIAAFFLLQIVMLLSAIVMELLDKRVMWHKKFFSYRVMAELLRQTEFLWPVGFCDVRYRHRSYSGDKRRWTTWYYRALVREKGLPCLRITGEHLTRWLLWVRDVFVIGQMNYHAKRYRREGNISAKLFRLGILLFSLGIFVSALRGYMASQGTGGGWVLTIPAALALVLPSLAVFCTGFCGYAGYPSNRQVSQEAEECLGSIRQDIDIALTYPEAASSYSIPKPLCYTHARMIAERLHASCIEELMDWEALISSKSIKCQ